MQLPSDIEKAINGLTKVTLKGGVVGKVSFFISISAIAIAVIAWASSNVWVCAVLGVLLIALVFTSMWKLINFADRHPQAALFEGAEFLAHEQIIHATKNGEVINVEFAKKTVSEQVIVDGKNQSSVRLPDESPQIDNEEGK